MQKTPNYEKDGAPYAEIIEERFYSLWVHGGAPFERKSPRTLWPTDAVERVGSIAFRDSNKSTSFPPYDTHKFFPNKTVCTMNERLDTMAADGLGPQDAPAQQKIRAIALPWVFPKSAAERTRDGIPQAILRSTLCSMSATSHRTHHRRARTPKRRCVTEVTRAISPCSIV